MSNDPNTTLPRFPERQEASLPMPAFATARTVFALLLREMSTTYGASPGGYVWALLSPLLGIAMLTAALSYVVRTPPLGTSFILFYATGVLPFGLFNSMTAKVGASIQYSRPLLAYPRVTWMDSFLARCILNMMTAILVFCIIIGLILGLTDTHAVVRLVPIVEGLGIMALTGIGVGLMNCLIAGYVIIWPRIYAIASGPLFFASGIFFLVDDLPREALALLSWLPVTHGVSLTRSGFYPSYHPQFVDPVYCFGLALSLIALALCGLRFGYLRALER